MIKREIEEKREREAIFDYITVDVNKLNLVLVFTTTTLLEAYNNDHNKALLPSTSTTNFSDDVFTAIATTVVVHPPWQQELPQQHTCPPVSP